MANNGGGVGGSQREKEREIGREEQILLLYALKVLDLPRAPFSHHRWLYACTLPLKHYKNTVRTNVIKAPSIAVYQVTLQVFCILLHHASVCRERKQR